MVCCHQRIPLHFTASLKELKVIGDRLKALGDGAMVQFFD